MSHVEAFVEECCSYREEKLKILGDLNEHIFWKKGNAK